jgi:hypothetical protein
MNTARSFGAAAVAGFPDPNHWVVRSSVLASYQLLKDILFSTGLGRPSVLSLLRHSTWPWNGS